ncbi:MAG: murein L,D-transpeptidase YafK [Sulfurimonas sp.]|jgi:murein L,D-transpeptidase YafK|uniref:L,D-transpeptidase family protein n=1 Tax=Sulfurimonas sp. TaxID=2022749 RepID=UPI0039E6579E
MLNKIALLLLLSISMYANSILTNYRIHGIQDVEKQMDLELTYDSYWYQHIKNIDTSFGYLESYQSILTCNKEKSTLSLFKNDEKKKFIPIEKYNAFTGKIKGDKVKEGDLKTPIGLYTIEKKISKLDSFYGPLAFVTTYPNIYDKYKGKNGSGIWIHGLPTEQERDDYTKGCIAINNENIVCLDKEVNIDSTLLIINPQTKTKEVSKKILAKILANLYQWRYSWLYNDTEKYLSFYSKDFVRDDGMKYSRFIAYKTRIFKKAEKKKITFTDINLVPYPNTKDVFQITFKEFYASSSFTFEGDKTLMIKIDKNNNFQIFTEK